jgi:hypothetical protein
MPEAEPFVLHKTKPTTDSSTAATEAQSNKGRLRVIEVGGSASMLRN